MTALAGLWHFDGRPAADRCARMLAAQELYGPDAPGQWSDGGVALGRQLMRLLPEDSFDRQPLIGGGGRYVMVADVRLDNRDELAAALDIPAAAAQGLCDAAILLTVDLPKTGRRERDIRNRFSLPEGLAYANLGGRRTRASTAGLDPFAQDVNAQAYAGLGWGDLEWLVAKTSLPVIVKGVVRGDDAHRAVEAGARGLIVSNHGGRQLDYSIASLDALPEVVQAVGGKVPVLLDGGVRRGTDVIKALCLGASAVLIGRPYLYALAVGGADGVRGMLELLREEIALSMSLLGVRRLSELNQDLLERS